MANMADMAAEEQIEQIICIIESIHKKKRRADLETIFKEAKDMNLSKEDMEILLNKLCDEDILRKVHSHGKCGFCFVSKVTEERKGQKDSIIETLKDNIEGHCVTNINDSASDISEANDWNADDISEANDWNTDDFFHKQHMYSSEKFSNYTYYLKGLSDLKEFLAFEINSLKSQQANPLTEYLKQENEFLKNELKETRLIINNILENFSRQNHPGESLQTKSDDKWEVIPKGRKSNKSFYQNRSTYKNGINLENRFEDLPYESDDDYSNETVINKRTSENNNDKSDQIHDTNITNRKSINRRPQVVSNNHPENQHSFRSVPGNNLYNEAVTNYREEKNISIISDSIPRGLRMREFNTYIKGGRAHLKAFQGATAKCLHHYILPTLKEDTPEIVILHVGYNDLSPKENDLGNINIESIANEIINIGKTCHQHGVETVVISSIVCNRNYKKQSLIDRLNNVLEEKMQEFWFIIFTTSQYRKGAPMERWYTFVGTW